MKPIQGFGNPTLRRRRHLISCVLAAAVGLIVAFVPIGARAAEPEAGPPPNLAADTTRKEFEKLVGEVEKLKFENSFKNGREWNKLSSEVEKLKFENGFWGRWFASSGIAVLGFIASVGGAWLTSRNERKKTLQEISAKIDQATHEKRLDRYDELMKAMAPLALFFSKGHKIDQIQCLKIGNAMSDWYFTTGGLLLSKEARDEYFCLARALTKAFRSDTILAPAWEQYAKFINNNTISEYRKRLGISIEQNKDEKMKEWDERTRQTVENWEFGKEWPDDKKRLAKEVPPDEQNKLKDKPEQLAKLKEEIANTVDSACAFKDYILLQTLSSRLRTALTEDIQSRRRPTGERETPGSDTRAPVFSRGERMGWRGALTTYVCPARDSAQNAASSKAGSTERPHGPS